MESLMKYVPFVEFLLKLDKEKYYKFIKIREWILSKTHCSPNVAKNAEGAILTQYKNLLTDKEVKIPQEVTDSFAPSISLCSDDEEDDSQNNSERKEEKSKYSNTKQNIITTILDDDEDDDLEFISINYIEKEKKDKVKPVKVTSVSEEYDIDEASKDILNKIDQIAANDLKLKSIVHEPVNYTFKMECGNMDENGKEEIFQRRPPNTDTLFKRRADFPLDEVIVECLDNEKTSLLDSEKQIEVIALDSESESEVCNDDEPSLNLNAEILNKENMNETTETKLETPESVLRNTDSNSNGSYSAKNNEKIDLLCNSIESVLPEMADILNEVEEVAREATEKRVTVQENEKESTVEQIVDTSNNGIPNLNPEEISKLLEDISSKTDFELETFCEALQYVRKMNSEQREIPETPPPEPPSIPSTVTTAPPVPPCYEQQHPQIVQPPIKAGKVSNTDFMTLMPPAPKPKLNLNDPRIKKQLQVIKNSPIFSYNILNNDLEESIRKICHETVMQPSTLSLKINNTGPPVSQTSSASATSKSTITYGEYKRRQLEKKLEMERKREEERKAKQKAELERENSKQGAADIRSQLLTTLNPCKEVLYSLWKQQNQPEECQQPKDVSNANSKRNSPEKSQKENIQTKLVNNTQKSYNAATSKTSNKQSKNKKMSDQKLNRIYSELKCTVKGFDQIQDYIAEETNISFKETLGQTNSSTAMEEAPAPRPIGLRRRSSIHALSAITEQLGLQSDGSDSELSRSSSRRLSRNWSHGSSSEDLPQDTFHTMPKRKKTDAVTATNQRRRALPLANDETSSSDAEVEPSNNLKTRCLTKIPIIKLHRMSNAFIRKHTKRARSGSADAPTNVADQSLRLKKTSEIVESLQEPCQKLPKLKKYNNDCQMTERNTVFCVLCRSKPMDLTNHYKGRHKIESYVSRLDWADLEDLAVNTHFAVLQPNSKNSRFERYEVECPFCKEKIIDQFINLYNHYSVHTGEYAFQCSHCLLSKPYKPDIQSHILHSKTCRNSSIQIQYRYSPQAQCIYLHYCIICNFVQLNEANVLKHLREHHDRSKAVESNVQKCILAAMSDGPDACQTKKSDSPPLATDAVDDTDLTANVTPCVKEQAAAIEISTTSEIKFKVDDDNILVSNEPCLEEEYMDNMLHKEAKAVEPLQPMTVVHNFEKYCHENAPPTTTVQLSAQPPAIEYHQPMQVKHESLQYKEETTKLTTPSTHYAQKQPAVVRNVNAVYEKYRSYPPNVNYLGLYKCMIDDCYYSTDCIADIITHLTEHSSDVLQHLQYLQCPYCTFTSDAPIQLAEHVRTQHGHLKFQCSLCCYRSCDASNVNLHQQMSHNHVIASCKIYKSSAIYEEHVNFNLDEKIEQNIMKISCKICFQASFYHTQLLINHIYNDHNIASANNLHIYSCINCPFTVDNKNQLKTHIATKHPGERPLIYDHNAPITNANEDCRNYSNVVDISEPVPYVEADELSATTTANVSTEEISLSQDIKPDFKVLLQMNEETAKVRLRKLTSHTGIAPDNLYRCPEQSCGGFFSNAELWLNHMKVRHLKLECQCPHCPTVLVLPLEQFAGHFEQHRRHTYICFYCSTTSPNESLARKHAAQKHSEFRQMRFEKICYNISYSYWIMIQRELFQEREKFIAEFLIVLDNRLSELERNEIKNLKQQWPLRENTPWHDDYLQNLPKRKVARRCLVKDCNFRTLKEENLYRHLSTSHTITGTQFNCSKCDYHLEKCNDLDELFSHIKLHNEYHFICAACSLVTSSRSKITAHIEEQHSARDVPVVHLFRISDKMYHKFYIVFADDNITFSTMRNCFCCSEKNMSGDVFSLHLKRYHNFSLTYCCENCTNFSFKSLQEVKPHFEQFHNSAKFKIRCELAGHSDVHVLSLNDFRVEILTPAFPFSQQNSSTITVKNEPLDVSDSDNVVLIEDDDIIIENSLKEVQRKQAELPKLKCISFSKLLEPNQNQQAEARRLKCAAFSKMVQPNATTSACVISPTMPVARTLPVIPAPSTQGYYNLGQQNLNTNQLMNNMNALNQIPAVSVQNNNNFVVFNRTIIRPVIANSNRTLTSLNANNNLQNLPNNQCMDQNCNIGYVSQPNNMQIPHSATPSYLMMPQNYQYNTFGR